MCFGLNMLNIKNLSYTLLCIATSMLCISCKTREIGSGAPTNKYKRTLVFEDNFNRAATGKDWKRGYGEDGKGKWRIEKGWLRADNIKNDPLWLTRPLPDKVRVEFDAQALSKDGDVKFEIFGDGKQHSSGYVAILGGWKNSLDIIARLDEHGKDRLSKPSIRPKANTTYRLAAERTDDNLRFYVNDKLVLTYKDKKALRGPQHQFFAFNDWTAPVRFDNIKIYKLDRP